MDSEPYTIRRAGTYDHNLLANFLSREFYIHRHLDWRPPLEWLGYQPYWLLENRAGLQAVLACPPDPESVAWIRLFATSSSLQPSRGWQLLFERVQADFRGEQDLQVVAVALQQWFAGLLENSGFTRYQDIVVLSWNNQDPPARPLESGLRLRAMTLADLPAVEQVDNAAFEPIWQNSLDDITRAFRTAASATVAELDGQIAGFQISTSSPLSTHLARLAVRPDLQRRNIGYALVNHLFSYFRRNGSWQLTVNTQDSNTASLALYQSLGFELTGDRFPVYLYQ